MKSCNEFLIRVVCSVFVVVVATFSLGALYAPALAEQDGAKLGYENDLLDLLCADQGAWLECYQQIPAQCREVLRPIVHKCVSSALADVKTPINLKTGLEKNVKIIECLNQEFSASLGLKRKNEERCKEQPKHLK
jgi:hypothetical protein